jgi:hypothetical protein
MNGRRADHLAGRLAAAGATLGIVAGLLELTIGPSIREWVGDKQDTTRLGLTTIVLSSAALAAAASLRRRGRRAGGRRLAVVLGLVVPAVICFTTVGRLWLLPGPLLLAAAGLLLVASERQELRLAIDERRWWIGLVACCGAYYVFLGATALGIAGLLGMFGGLLIWAAVAAASFSRTAAYALLMAGALPFAVATWWSLVTPLIAAAALAIGHVALRQNARIHLSEEPSQR